jgi:hypothetical protein
MGLNMTRLARPFRANEIMETLHPGLRCAPPWAIIVRRFAAIMALRIAAIMARRFAAGCDVSDNCHLLNVY